MNPHPNDSISPSITIIKPTQAFTDEKIDKLKLNNKTWLEDTDLFLTVCRLSGYTNGTILFPGTNEPRVQTKWHANDKLATALLFNTIEKTEWEFLDRKLGVKACWDALTARHQNQGPIQQVNYLEDAMTTKFSRSAPLPVTAEKNMYSGSPHLQHGQYLM